MKIAIQSAVDTSLEQVQQKAPNGAGPHDSGVHSIDLENTAAKVAKSGTATLFKEMEEAFSQLDHAPLREVLLDSVQAEQESVEAIASSFARFTEKRHSLLIRQTFFASWQKTNNSAMSVEGLANRLTDLGESSIGKLDDARCTHLFRSAGRLNRVTDEDLGVRGQVLHFELYYRMATELADRNDDWQSRRFCLPVASEFKSWLDAARLRQPIMTGLFSMLVHEGYTHAELEVIAPQFYRLATQDFMLDNREAKKALAWITVHNGGTEKKHFAHSCAALKHYCDATGTEIDLDHASDVFRSYLRRKGAVMAALDGML
ncbi:MAG TPA: hypothetical protein VGL13_04465 [Polyangiaceae bacterium]|jgi:hypothetical protein